jgi:DNA-binding LytR/AlgR family response regulator
MAPVSRRVLIVEDEFFVALDLELLVHKRSPAAEVVVCSSLTEARAAAKEPFGLALLDIDVLDGRTYEVAQDLKGRGTQVVFVSGSNRHEVPEALRDVPFIPKPYAPPLIEATISAALAGAPPAQEARP